MVIWYRGERTVSADELLTMLPAKAQLINQQISNIFLVEVVDADAVQRALGPDEDWTFAPQQVGHSLHLGNSSNPR